MPYGSNSDLLASVQAHLPPHAQDIYREAFNHAFAARASDPHQEERAHRIAWSAAAGSAATELDLSQRLCRLAGYVGQQKPGERPMSAGTPESKASLAEDAAAATATPALSISPEKVCFIVVKAREFDAKDVVTIPDDASNATDDAMMSVLEDHADDPVVAELRGFIGALTEDEQVDLVALTWLGRGDGTLDDWEELRAEAARLHNKRTASYLLGMPLLPDHLEDALSQFGCSCEEFEMGHL